MDLGTKFRKYYARYEKLYKDISASVEAPSEKKKEELMSLHKMLGDIKKQLASVR